MVGSTDAILYIPNRKVEWVEFIIACANRYCSFVTAKNNWHECAAMHCVILGDNVLCHMISYVHCKMLAMH